MKEFLNFHYIKQPCNTTLKTLKYNLIPMGISVNEIQTHLFLKEVLPVLQSSQPVLLVFMFQVVSGGLEVANQILQTQTD